MCFSVFYIVSSKTHEGGSENSRQVCKPEKWWRVCITFENSPTPKCLDKVMNKSTLLLLQKVPTNERSCIMAVIISIT